MVIAQHFADDARALPYARLNDNPISDIAYKMRRCTGFSPSRMSGSARPMITLIA
jgi:hypothetical protein